MQKYMSRTTINQNSFIVNNVKTMNQMSFYLVIKNKFNFKTFFPLQISSGLFFELYLSLLSRNFLIIVCKSVIINHANNVANEFTFEVKQTMNSVHVKIMHKYKYISLQITRSHNLSSFAVQFIKKNEKYGINTLHRG